ncbi:lysosome-associated membrane glycoprotein 2 isoform X2 [Brienomyrus brachyistius]|uniref:lysosome-associated membrane glycoprotein 2 isoform X2 n=1 Tax=Brienomyrus brachyistius TaxID=42636 RepID=UPI0020B2EBB1|nr:lysosome-associated membrane glycoprotein 2 isoform X2 [Brienomyrus brachyistius]
MFRYACVTLLLLLAAGVRQSSGTEVKVEEDKKLCLYANLMLNFSVTYEVAGKKNATVTFTLPETGTTNGSRCGNDSSLLKIDFGKGHSWALNFTRDNQTYKVDYIWFTYDLKDDTIFKNSSSNDTKTVTVGGRMRAVDLNNIYTCKSHETLDSGLVQQVFWNVSLQAFISNGTLSKNATICHDDQPTPTPPSTTTITPKPTTTPKPTPLPQPTTGTYKLKPNDTSNSTACLLVTVGLQLHYTDGKEFVSENIDPNITTSGGNCGINGSDAVLVLKCDHVTISFTFVENKQKFFLHAVNVSVVNGNHTFHSGNANMSLWEAAVGSSYMCNKQQTVNVSDSLAFVTYDLRAQPFEVKNNSFATAEECFLDSDFSFLVPIAVGVALSFLIILVLISYLIGRRKSRTGYQSV